MGPDDRFYTVIYVILKHLTRKWECMTENGNVSLVSTYFIHSLLYNKQSTNNITKQLNERDLTVRVILYKSSPERWYDV